MKRLIAKFQPQAWVSDDAVECDEAIEFDATAQILSLPLESIRNFKEHDYDSDSLAEGLPERQHHDGPFEVYADIDEWLEENDVDGGRQNLTQEDLDRLRKQFAAEYELPKVINVRVVFPQNFQFQVDESWLKRTRKEKREAILDHAAYLMETSPPDGEIEFCDDWHVI